ncbi:MAG: 3-dehydroquinate synthase [Phycisphaerae bacterium]|nr:3-dehydroquinate synthase [Phycisphaerae bacterium]
MNYSFSVRFTYPVLYSDDLFSPGNQTLTNLIDSGGTRRAVAFVDGGLHAAASAIIDRIESSLGDRLAASPVVIEGGEAAKSGLRNVEKCVSILNDAKIDRHSYVIAIGGGAVLDVVGFASAITHRGVRLIRVPSTVLAQNDAGIGVKNGINLFGKKNFLGTFAPPFAVINDFSLLSTLPAKMWRDGTAEAVKVSLVRSRAFFEWIESHVDRLVARDDDIFRRLIRRCADEHLEHIKSGGDPFEQGSARPLDYGHWSAHKLESLCGPLLSHGHAVAIGMAIDALYAGRAGICAPSLSQRIVHCLRALQFPLTRPAPISTEDVLSGIDEFREHLGGALSIAMVPEIGQRIEISEINREIMRGCIEDVLSGELSR